MSGRLLALFSGVFLAAGAGHLLPEAQHQRPAEAPSLIALTTVGALIVIVVRALIGGQDRAAAVAGGGAAAAAARPTWHHGRSVVRGPLA